MADTITIVGHEGCMFFMSAVNAGKDAESRSKIKIDAQELKMDKWKTFLAEVTAAHGVDHENSPIIFKGAPKTGKYIGGCDEWLEYVEDTYPSGQVVRTMSEPDEQTGATHTVEDNAPVPTNDVISIVGKRGDLLAMSAYDASQGAADVYALQIEKIEMSPVDYDKWVATMSTTRNIAVEGSCAIFVGSPEKGEYVGGNDDWLEYISRVYPTKGTFVMPERKMSGDEEAK